MELQDRLIFFRELISCNQDIYYWCYDADGSLLASSCPQETVFQPIFRSTGCLNYALSAQVETPMILSNAANLVWGAVWETRAAVRERLHVIGPCLSSSLSPQVMEHARRVVMDTRAYGSDGYKKRLLAGLEQIPVLPNTVFYHYTAMLGRCVTGQKVALSELHQQSAAPDKAGKPPPLRDRMNVYRAERLLLQTVRDGDLDGHFALDNASHVSTLQPYVPDSLGQVQIAYTILTSLCVRAAIEGGLSPERAYSTGDRYIQRFFLTHTITEATALKLQMYQELVEAVHKCRSDPRSSKVVQSCKDYIELHLEESLTLETLAIRLGYTKYYLSRRFKAEAGCTVNGYIQIARIERAKSLLVCTDLSMTKIAERLQFATVSHFSTVFKRLTGESPAQYRACRQSC